MKTFHNSTTAIFTAIILIAFWGCSHYIAANPATDVSSYPSLLERAKKAKKYFIMQSGINIYTVTSVDLDQAKKQMTVTLDKVDSVRLVHFKNPSVRENKQKEIFLLMKDSTSYTLDEPHTIPLERVAKVETN